MSAIQIIAHPIFPCALLAIGLAFCTFLFVTVKQDLVKVHRHHADIEQRLEGLLRASSNEISAVKIDLKTVEEKASTLPQMSAPKPGMNMSRRSQVLRMHRRGEKAWQIAAALNLPLKEVELLLKVHQATQTAVG
ncbi:MAG: hypothetical protein GY953_28915 [bacterium]|nr:hypothetical protein [bacterium]